MTRQRLDRLVVSQGLAPDLTRARALIMAGQMVVNDHLADKPGLLFAPTVEVRRKGEQLPYVSRGGLKLRKALDEFAFDVAGMVAVDVGSSTGGFTDCLLQAGAARVYAIDVGYGQLAWKLQTDPRVISMERTNIRTVSADQLAEIPTLAVIDASFISLVKVLPPTVNLLTRGGHIIALVKPQFEVSRGAVGKGGVVRDVAAQQQVVEDVSAHARELGLEVAGMCESPITGADGNREFLLLLRCHL